MERSIEVESLHLGRLPYLRVNGTAVDVGANAGVYTYQMSRHFECVFAFEANPAVTAHLRAWRPANVHLVHEGLSDAAGEAVLRIPVQNDRELTGWASFGSIPVSAERYIEKRVPVASLDSYELERVALLKIDVEGHEVEVLRGAERTIASWRPTAIVEARDETRDSVRVFFRRLDYLQAAWEGVIGRAGSPQNFLFVPRELLTRSGEDRVQR